MEVIGSICSRCGTDYVYMRYTVRICGSDPLHVFKCPDCSNVIYDVRGPSGPDTIRIHDN